MELKQIDRHYKHFSISKKTCYKEEKVGRYKKKTKTEEENEKKTHM